MESATAQRARRIGRYLAVAASAVGVVALAGYAFDVPSILRAGPRLQGMSPLTACAIFLLGTGIFAASRDRVAFVAPVFAAVVALVAAALAGHLVHDGDVASPWVAQHLFGVAAAASGQMSTGTALALLLVGIGVMLRDRPALSDAAVGAGLMIALTALLGYSYGVEPLSTSGLFATMAPQTALALTVLAIATLLIEPGIGWSRVVLASGEAGGTTRRQLGLLMLPIAVGWLLKEATVRNHLASGSALALLVLLTITPMVLLVLRDGRTLAVLEGERRRHAAAQAALTLELEQRLATKTAELETESAERSRIEESMYRTQRVEAIGQLTGGIAHDFNNLLAAIGGNLELLSRKLPAEHPARRHAATAAAAVGKGARLASQLLAFSRSQRLTIRPTEIVATLKQARELIGNMLGPSIELLIEYSRDSTWAKTDADQLEFAIFNLAVNARDAMPYGGQLRIESDVRRLRLPSSTDERSYVSIRVIDDGVGMTPDVLVKAIEPFFTTRERGKGSGLGLAQVYGFVRQCEGDLHIVSAPGEGTTVEILLPWTAAPVVEDRPGARVEAPARHAEVPTRLLVVDDDESVRGVLVELLGQAGYDVTEAADGIAALACLERIDPQVAVIDFLMPGMNGAEVARRAQARIPDLPIVFVSGYADTVALDGIAGAIVLRKPFEDQQLQAAVESALDLKPA